MSNFLLYLITHRGSLTSEQFNHKIIEAIKGGVSIIQLREKDISASEYIRRGREIKDIVSQYGIPLIINDNPYVAKEVGAGGVHLGQGDCSVEEARSVLGKDALIGLSIENLVQAASVNKADINYTAIGPVFPTTTKKDAVDPVGIDAIKMIRLMVSKPLLAIGGINKANISEIIGAGVDGICVSSAIFAAADTKYAAQELKARMKHEATH